MYNYMHTYPKPCERINLYQPKGLFSGHNDTLFKSCVQTKDHMNHEKPKGNHNIHQADKDDRHRAIVRVWEYFCHNLRFVRIL